MDNNELDAIIKNGIKNAPIKKDLHMEMRQPVMERIENYEMVKARRPGMFTIFLYLYSLAAGLLSIIFFDKAAAYFKPFLQSFPTGTLIVEATLRGIFIFIPACLIIMAIYYRRSARVAS